MIAYLFIRASFLNVPSTEHDSQVEIIYSPTCNPTINIILLIMVSCDFDQFNKQKKKNPNTLRTTILDIP